MRLCMFHPLGHPLERGWVGRVEGDRVVQLAAQTLQSFFTGGGAAREHEEYPLGEVQLLAPILHPPSIRVFDDQGGCAFANPAAIRGNSATIESGRSSLTLVPRLAAVIGTEGAPAAFTIFAEWRDPARRPPKDRDFALGLGPVAVTPEELEPDGRSTSVRVDGTERATGAFTGFDWPAAVSLAADGNEALSGRSHRRAGAVLVEDIAPAQPRRDGRRRDRCPRAAGRTLSMEIVARLGRHGHRGRRAPPRAARVRRGRDLRGSRVPARARSHAARGHRRRVSIRPSATSGGRRVRAGERSAACRVRASSPACISRSSSRAASTS